MVEIAELTTDHVHAWRALRLRALASAPAAFLQSVEEAEAQPLEELAARFSPAANVDSPIFGAFLAGDLVGTAGLARQARLKARHTAMLWGVFVAPEHRGLGIADALVAAVLARARAMPGLERITLAVLATNSAARKLYHRAGFVPYGYEPRAIRVGDEFFDDEHMVLDLRR